jgi:hypothetical protein
MSPASINAFRLKSAAVQNTAHGVAVTFRGAPILVCLSSVRITLDLEIGGLRQGGEYTCRFLASSLATPPGRGEIVIFNARRYVIQDVRDLISTPGEYVVTLHPGSRA